MATRLSDSLGFRVLLSVAAMLAARAGLPIAQTAFEVTSVKVNTSGRPGSDVSFRPDQFVAVNVTLRQLLAEAHSLETFRIVGGPDWIDRERFDVQARAQTPVARGEALPMLQALLVDRFALKARVEQRERPIYALVLASRDGKLGPRLTPAVESACVARIPGVRRPAGEPPTCGQLTSSSGRAAGRSVGLDLLASELSRPLDRVVVNRTGVPGLFDLDLEWSVDPTSATTDSDRTPVLATALDEQLGLRLQSATGRIDVLVVDAAARPSGN